MDTIFLATAFLAGVVSFLAPCVLPIIPGFLAYLAGSTSADSPNRRRDIFVNSVFFVLGFSVVFALLGILLQTVLASIGGEVQSGLSKLGGLVIIFFGLYLTGLIKIAFLERDHKVLVKKKFSSRYLTSFVFGTAFAVGWTPCAGAVLGSILGLAASAPVSAFFLLLSYALGLGMPFLLVGLFTAQATRFIDRYAGAFVYVNKLFGVVLVLLGILVFTESLSLVGNFDFVNSFILSR
ncbi:MAG: cytochrome c-type biogenesis protein [Parcubacteria bacterium C7867-004]|nr:MAG: cytochrome c-type biogenesis protein [Parcubacteria bacterium C7867-004]